MASRLAVLVLANLACNALHAHEYWLDPEAYHLQPGDTLSVDIRNGEDFIGISYPFDAQRYRSLVRFDATGQHDLPGRLGNYPAISTRLDEPGLHAVVLETEPQIFDYPTFERFHTFLAYHGLESVQAVHRQRGLPDTGIRERYLRFAKTLVSVTDQPLEPGGNCSEHGSSVKEHARPEQGALAASGLSFELVMLRSPYDGSGSLPLELWIFGQPLADAQVEVFFQDDGPATRARHRTDAQGRLSIPVALSGSYLVNAVQLIPPRSGAGQPHWESLWASLTFQVRPAVAC